MPLLLLILLSTLFSVFVASTSIFGPDGSVFINEDSHYKFSRHDARDVTFATAAPLVRIDHHHVGKRDLHHELFAPTRDIVLDWIFSKLCSRLYSKVHLAHNAFSGDGKIQSYHYEHNNSSYINLEPLQSHGMYSPHAHDRLVALVEMY
jgi:hypothetical protein